MDKETTIEELKKIVLKFRDDRDWKQFHNPKDAAIALITESAELLEHFRFRTLEEIKEYLNDPKNKEEVAHELADVLSFVVILADEMDIDITECLIKKTKIQEKKYPIHLSKGSNKKYTELQ